MSERTARELTSILQALRHDATLTPRLGEVVTRLFTTAGQVILRFSQYAEYPARASLMSRAYNPATYYQEIMRFLHIDAKALDSGYCGPLRQEAWSAAGRSSGSLTDAVLHLVSQLVQEELATIAMAIETSTLDVERKHNLDRRSEARTVASVAKASRDGFVRHWRAESRAAASTAKAHKELRAQKFANKVSIAYERRPDLFPQAHGKLHWEHAAPKCRRRLREHGWRQRLLKQYMEEHKDDLEVEMARRHARAQQGPEDRVTSWPLSKAGWLSWLEKEQPTAYEKALELAKSGARRAVNVRVTPRPDVPQKDPAIRLQPNTDPPRPAWARKLCNGWHALRLKDKVTRVVVFVVRCAGKLVAFVPAETPGRGFEVPLLFRIDECLGPLREVLPMSFYFSDDVEVLRLTVHCGFKDKCFWIQPYKAEPPLPQRKSAEEEEHEESVDDDTRSEEGFDCTHDKWSDLSESEKDMLSLCSSVDSDLEMHPTTSGDDCGVATAVARTAAAAATDGSDDSEQWGPQDTRAAQHTHTAWQNDYFVLTDNRNFPDVRMRVKDRWKGVEHLGRSCGSKTLVPGHYGDDRAEPDQVILVLKAWMIYRWQQNDGRFLQRSCRERAWQTEVQNLMRDVARRGGELALHLATRARLREWAPQALP